MKEITGPFDALPDDPVPLAADVDFPIVLRGYDRLAVDAYVKKTSQLVAELQATRSPDAAIRRALERVGAQVAGILQRAHESAEQITSQAQSEVEEKLEAARQEAVQITADAENGLQELDAETDRIWAERHRIVEDARALARQLLALADSAAERFPPAEEPVPQEGGELGIQQQPRAVPGEVPTAPGDEPPGEPEPTEESDISEGAWGEEEPQGEGEWSEQGPDRDPTAVMPRVPPPGDENILR
jgi:cell division septum initiation protein DivIVA